MKTLSILVISLLLCFIYLPSFSQNTVLLDLGFGATVTDIETLAEDAGDIPVDWSEFSYQISIQYFRELSKFEVGAEVGYHYLYWYTYRVLTGGGSTVREWNESITKIAVLIRTGLQKRFKYTGGVSLNIFENGAAGGIINKVAWHIPVNDSLDIPIGLRTDLIFADKIMFPILLSTGVSYKF